MRYFVSLILCAYFLLFSLLTVNADEGFSSSYKAEYSISSVQDTVTARVRLTVTLTNLRSDIVVNKLTLSFPKTFSITNIKAEDNIGPLKPVVNSDNFKTNVQIEFSDPIVGKDEKNTFILEYDQENLFKANGNVWEVMLPVIEDPSNTDYLVIINLPSDEEKKISIAKPLPDEIHGKTISWKNPKTKTIYAVFGNTQNYKTRLLYHLKNSRITPAYTDIALPPDTLYQKTFIQSLNPKPEAVYIDEDGNYMARYSLKPAGKLDIEYVGIIQVYSTPRTDIQPIVQNDFQRQKSYLLTQKAYWDLGSELATVSKVGKERRDIYNFVRDSLTYNYQRIDKKIRRLGAAEVLSTPDQAVCTEFTDAFVAIAREKGIYSREIEGYGFSNDPQLRPLSLATDVLHAWPEYYDEVSGLWIPVDPTWESTSGIDYFSSFDLNHIVFAIHGKKPDYPPPAGSYKQEDTKDVSIVATKENPEGQVDVNLLPFKFPEKMVNNQSYDFKIKFRNNSNIFLFDTPIRINSDNLESSSKDITIPSFAPYEVKEINFTLSPKQTNKKDSARLSISIFDNPVYSSKVVILPFYYDVGLKVGFAVIALSIFVLSLRLFKRRKHTH